MSIWNHREHSRSLPTTKHIDTMKFTTSFPDEPCIDFYDWYRHIHGNCPVEVREKIDRHGNRRERLPITPDWPLPDNWDTMSPGDRMVYNMAMAEQRDFDRLMVKFKNSFVS